MTVLLFVSVSLVLGSGGQTDPGQNAGRFISLGAANTTKSKIPFPLLDFTHTMLKRACETAAAMLYPSPVGDDLTGAEDKAAASSCQSPPPPSRP